jgi:hypothetical protein
VVQDFVEQPTLLACIAVVFTRTLQAGLGTFWDAVTSPDALNTEAAALGPQVNVFASGGKLVPVSPAFIAFQPTVYPRPFNRPPFG